MAATEKRCSDISKSVTAKEVIMEGKRKAFEKKMSDHVRWVEDKVKNMAPDAKKLFSLPESLKRQMLSIDDYVEVIGEDELCPKWPKMDYEQENSDDGKLEKIDFWKKAGRRKLEEAVAEIDEVYSARALQIIDDAHKNGQRVVHREDGHVEIHPRMGHNSNPRLSHFLELCLFFLHSSMAWCCSKIWVLKL